MNTILLSKSTRSEFSIWVSDTRSIAYSVTSRGYDGLSWLINKISGEKETHLIRLEADPVQGLELVRIKKTTAGTKAYNTSTGKNTQVNETLLLGELNRVCTDPYRLPSEMHPSRTGSIFLTVALTARNKAEIDSNTLAVNGLAQIKPLTTESWVDAYLEVQNLAGIPDYVNAEFLEKLELIGVDTSDPACDVLKFAVAIAKSESESESESEPVEDLMSLETIAGLSLDDLKNTLTKVQLVNHCKAYGLTCKGSKDVLAQSLFNLAVENHNGNIIEEFIA